MVPNLHKRKYQPITVITFIRFNGSSCTLADFDNFQNMISANVIKPQASKDKQTARAIITVLSVLSVLATVFSFVLASVFSVVLASVFSVGTERYICLRYKLTN